VKKEMVGRLEEVGKSCGEIRDVLLDCSREVIGEDRDDGWPTAQALFNLSKDVDSMRRRLVALVEDRQIVVARIAESKDVDKSQFEEKHRLTTAEDRSKVGEKPQRLSPKRKADYPRYYVRGDAIVKRGLARDRRSEYEHVVPKADFEKILTQLKLLAPSGFTSEQLHSKLEIPAYRTYLVLSLLRKLELLEVPRRGNYCFRSPDAVSGANDIVWHRVCEKLTQEFSVGGNE